MKLVPLVLLSLLASCGTFREWRELQTAPMTLGACYDGLVFVARGARFMEDPAFSDRGLGTWQSRWRRREAFRNFPIRNRLIAEILIDDGSTEKGWRVRYYIEQEKVDDLRRHASPREEDWSADGQDSEREALLGAMLSRRLAPPDVPAPER